MHACPHVVRLLRRLAGLAIAGGAILLFAGPLLTALAVTAVCAVVGFVAWLPLHTVFVGRRSVWHGVCGRVRGGWACALDRCRGWNCGLWDLVEAWTTALATALLEVVCGAIIGVGLALLTGAEEPAVGIAALIGAAAGAGVVFVRRGDLATLSPAESRG